MADYFYPGESNDWVEVADFDCGEMYSWDEFRAYYSPSARRYFWGEASGCSCYSFADDFGSEADYSNGDKAALLRAAREWEDGGKTDLVDRISTFKEPK